MADCRYYSTQGFGVSGSAWNIGLFQSFSGFSDKIVSIEPNMLRGSYSNRLGVYPAKSNTLIIYLIPSKYYDSRRICTN